MRFGQTLRNAIYPPWKDQYIDYSKLKALLREGADTDTDQPWTEDDESRFCDEILNVQLEKVAAFQAAQFRSLEARADAAGEKLRGAAPGDAARGDIASGRLREVEDELDGIVGEMRELKRYSAINYTGFLKIVKKHDRKRGSSYKIRPMVQISLANRPFNSEAGYSPLSNKLSTLYFAVRQQLDGGEGRGVEGEQGQGQVPDNEEYTAYKCGCPVRYIPLIQPRIL
jgi:SPX domain protein involved in polyphosphate accumulation